MFTLTMDSMFNNLATGITYKGENPIVVKWLESQTCLKYASMKLINWYEINKFKGKITPTGQIEKTIDAEEGWFTLEELIEYVRNCFTNNDRSTNEVNLVTDEDNDFHIGDRVEINLPECLTQGNFIVTEVKENTEGNNQTEYNIILRNTNLQENYIDLFRNSIDIEEKASQIETEYVVEYVEEESINEKHNIYLDVEEA